VTQVMPAGKPLRLLAKCRVMAFLPVRAILLHLSPKIRAGWGRRRVRFLKVTIMEK
jgi:hypothetical protein